MLEIFTLARSKGAAAYPFVTRDDMRPVDEFNHWIHHLRTEQHNLPKTLKQYANDLRDYYHFCKAVDVSPLKATSFELKHYLDDMAETRSVTPNTINGRARVLENFYKFLLSRNYVQSLPFALIISPEQECLLSNAWL